MAEKRQRTASSEDCVRPDETEVRRVLEERKQYYRRRDLEVRKDVELYQQDYLLDTPPDFHQVKTPTTKAVPDRLADRLGSGRMQVRMEPRRPGGAEKTRVEKLEKAAGALIYLARKREHFNPIRAMALHAFNRGAFAPKIQIDMQAFVKEPVRGDFDTEGEFKRAAKLWEYKRITRFPVIFGVRPIESLYPDPETDGENSVIEHYKRRVGDIKKNYPMWSEWGTEIGSLGRFKDDDRVDFTEIHDRDWRGAMVEGEWLPIGDFKPGPIENVFGRPPYFIRYAGFGDPVAEPHNKCVSILRAVRDTSVAQSRLLSIIDSVAENEAYGSTLVKKGDSGAQDFRLAPGAINEMDDPQAVRPYAPRGISGEIMSALSLMQSASEYGSAAGEAIGQYSNRRGAQAPSGVAAAIMTGQSSMLIDPVKGAIEDALSDIVPFLFWTFDTVVGEEVPIYGQVGEDSFVNLTLSPALIDGFYGPVYVNMLLREPESDYASWQLGIQAIEAGFPMDFVLDKLLKIENSGSMAQTMMARKIAFSPEVISGYVIPRFVEHLKAKVDSTADAMPGENVPAPAGASGLPTMTGMAGGDVTNPGVPGDAMARAQMGIAIPGPMAGPPITSGPIG